MSREDRQFLDFVTIGLALRNGDVNMPNNRKIAEQHAVISRGEGERGKGFGLGQ